MSTKVDITFRLTLDQPMTPEIRESLDNLAAVMLVQAEDGLYRFGWKDAEDEDEIPNSFMAEITSTHVTSIEAVRTSPDLTIVNGLRADLHDPDCPGMDEDGNWLGPCNCAEKNKE